MKRFISWILVAVLCFSCMILPASAATRSSGTTRQTITVRTKANWLYPGSSSIKISQSKGTIQYSKTNWRNQVTGSATKKIYGSWTVVARATDGSDYIKRTLSGSSVTLKLKPNKTYNITVTYNSENDTFWQVRYRNSSWKYYPTWRVSSTWKLSSCY